MPVGRNFQPLSYDLRLPDEAQADALRLLDASRQLVNTALVALWPRLDEFMEKQTGRAWKQVVAMMQAPHKHGDRQWRCEAETVGRLLRSQAQRKQIFLLVQPILSDGFIRPRTEKRPAGKNRTTIKEALDELAQVVRDDEAGFVLLQNVVEQACNHFLAHGEFPATYEAMQAVPVLSVGLLAYAGDDGGTDGQAYRFSLDLQNKTATLRFRCPSDSGRWHWRSDPVSLPLPDCVLPRLHEGAALAPTLRELETRDGERIAVLDLIVQVPKMPLADWGQIERVLGFDWGVNTLLTAVVLQRNPNDPQYPLLLSHPLFVQTGELDGHQARTRRQIDELKAKQATVPPQSDCYQQYEQEIQCCWRVYEARNQQLAHFAANLLLLFAQVFGCSLISGESLKTLKSTGRGRGVRGKWRNWRNNTTIRSKIWDILRYKSHLLGIRFRSERPRGTSHTCPRCGQAAETYRSSRLQHRSAPVKWGRWLVCSSCGYNADRDYCAAQNIARLGMAYLVLMQTITTGRAFSVTDTTSVKPCRYNPHGAVLLFPPPTPRSRLLHAGKRYCNGWKKSCTIHSSYESDQMFRFCG